jgi:hypothetical protein
MSRHTLMLRQTAPRRNLPGPLVRQPLPSANTAQDLLAAATRGAAFAVPPNGSLLAPLPALLPPKPLIDMVFTIPAQFLRYNPRTN